MMVCSDEVNQTIGIGFLILFCLSIPYASATELRDIRTFEGFEKFTEENAPNEEAFVAVQRLARPFLAQKNWKTASMIFKKFEPLFPHAKERFEKIITLLEAPEEELVVTNLGMGINTRMSEHSPTPSADGGKMYFTGRRRTDGNGGEDIYVSIFADGRWQKATNLGKSINTESNEAINSISADETTIILMGNYSHSMGRGDNFYIEKSDSGWTDVRRCPPPINSAHFDCDGFLTADGNAIIFSSDRPGGIGEFHPKHDYFHGAYCGNIDIYVCELTDTGWSEAINLGATINTPYCEYTPFLHPDGKTLYFSSDGHYGLGMLDVFKSVRLSDTSWTEWSEPVNLGKQINTFGHDWGYKVATAGDVAYFSAHNHPGGFGENDIFSITLPRQARPELAVVSVSGKVTDLDMNPLAATIKWEDLGAEKNVGIARSDPQTGEYFIALPAGKHYGYYAEKEGHYPTSKQVDLRKQKESAEKKVDIILTPLEKIEEGKIAVRVNNIFFDLDKYDLKNKSFPELNRLADILKEYKEWRVEIHGHTCSLGTEHYNQLLSSLRAEAVVEYLVNQAIDPSRLVAKGYGETQPIVSNETEEDRIRNRRVEFKIIK